MAPMLAKQQSGSSRADIAHLVDRGLVRVLRLPVDACAAALFSDEGPTEGMPVPVMTSVQRLDLQLPSALSPVLLTLHFHSRSSSEPEWQASMTACRRTPVGSGLTSSRFISSSTMYLHAGMHTGCKAAERAGASRH